MAVRDHGQVAGAAEAARVERLLRGPEDSRQANFLELFFDLVLVFALAGVVNRIVPDLSRPGAAQSLALLYAVVLALPLIWLWTTTAHITSRFHPGEHRVQLMVLASAFGLLVMSASLPYAFGERGLVFAAPYVLLQAGRPLLLRAMVRGHDALRGLYLRTAVWSGASAVFWIAGALVTDGYRVTLWLVAITVDLVGARLDWPVRGVRHTVGSAWAMSHKRHLPERYQQLLLIAIGETVLAAGFTYTAQPATTLTTTGLVVAFLSTVLLWRIYYYRSGQVLADALEAATDRAAVGRAVGAAHVVMVLGIVAVASGYEVVQKNTEGHSRPAWLAVILGGPVLFLIGRIRLERVVFDRVSVRRLVGIGALLVLSVPLAFTPPLVAGAAAAAVLLGIAIADARHAAGRPTEAPSPPAWARHPRSR